MSFRLSTSLLGRRFGPLRFRIATPVRGLRLQLSDRAAATMTKIQPDSVRSFRHDPLLLGSDADLNKLFLAVLLRLPALHARNLPLPAVVLKSGNPTCLTCNANVITIHAWSSFCFPASEFS